MSLKHPWIGMPSPSSNRNVLSSRKSHVFNIPSRLSHTASHSNTAKMDLANKPNDEPNQERQPLTDIEYFWDSPQGKLSQHSLSSSTLRPVVSPFLPGINHDLWGPPDAHTSSHSSASNRDELNTESESEPLYERSDESLHLDRKSSILSLKNLNRAATSASRLRHSVSMACTSTPDKGFSSHKQVAKLQSELENAKTELEEALKKIFDLNRDNQRLMDILHHMARSSSNTPNLPSAIAVRSPPAAEVIFPSTIKSTTSPSTKYIHQKPRSSSRTVLDSFNVAANLTPGIPSPDVPTDVLSSILDSSFDFEDVSVEMIRPVVWVIATRQATIDSAEYAGLKRATNILSGKLQVEIGPIEYAPAIIRAILDFAPALCVGHCGSQLCQRFLENAGENDRRNFLLTIMNDIVPISGNMYGIHVLVKAMEFDDLAEVIAQALFSAGVYEVMKTGARRLWFLYLNKARKDENFVAFRRIIDCMVGRWVDLICSNEDGAIGVQQIIEMPGSQELARYCWSEVMDRISFVANNPFACIIVSQFLRNPALFGNTCGAILFNYPPVALSHHGVSFVDSALSKGVPVDYFRYVEALCSEMHGTPGLIIVASAPFGKSHLVQLMSRYASPEDTQRIRHVSQKWCNSLRKSQSGTEFLFYLGIKFPLAPPPGMTSPLSAFGPNYTIAA